MSTLNNNNNNDIVIVNSSTNGSSNTIITTTDCNGVGKTTTKINNNNNYNESIEVQSSSTTTMMALPIPTLAKRTSQSSSSDSNSNSISNSNSNEENDDDDNDNDNDKDDDDSVEKLLLEFVDYSTQMNDNDNDNNNDDSSSSSTNKQIQQEQKQQKETKLFDDNNNNVNNKQPHAYPCTNTLLEELPPPPSQWPQAPIMIRPTPGSFTKIRGIRYANNMNYINIPGYCNGCILPINNGTEKQGQSIVIDFESKHFIGTLLMRIKNIPSAITSTSTSKSSSSSSYFNNRKRRFQAIVKGKFITKNIKICDCYTGQTFTRYGNTLPPKWILTSFIKFISTLAPQLDVTFDYYTNNNNKKNKQKQQQQKQKQITSQPPRFLSPLVATAQTVISKPCSKTKKTATSIYPGSTDIENDIEEPSASDPTSLMQYVVPSSILKQQQQQLPKKIRKENNSTSTTSSSTSSVSSSSSSVITSRMKVRKKAYNTITAQQKQKQQQQCSNNDNDNSHSPCFIAFDKEYTFEFYQHMLKFDGDDIDIDIGIGSKRTIGLSPITNGQPIKFMSVYKNPITHALESLWSFDIWHQSMYPYALQYYNNNQNQQKQN